MRAVLAAVLVFAACFVVYNLNGVPISSSDNKASLLLPHAVLTRGSLDLTPYFPAVPVTEPVPYFFRRHGAALSSDKLVFYSLVATPFYAAGWGIVRLVFGPLPELRFATYEAPPPLAWFAVEKVTASLMAAATSAAMFLALWIYWRRWDVAWGGVTAFSFCTSHWATTSQGMWNHGGLALLIALVALAWARLERSGADGLSPRTLKTILIAGSLAAAWLMPVRTTGAGYAIVWVAYVASRWRPWLAWAVGPVAAMGLLFFAFNLAMTGSLAGYYGMGQAPFWSYGWWENIKAWVGLLVSPGSGLFVFTPLAAVAVFGAVAVWRRGGPDDDALRWWVVPVVVCWAAAATVTDVVPQLRWHAAASYGSRYFVDALPALTLLGLQGTLRLQARAAAWSRAGWMLLLSVMALAAFWSWGTQVVGVFFFKFNHALRPRPIHLSPERMWDWRDNPIVRELRTGLNPDVALVWSSLSGRADHPALLAQDISVAEVSVAHEMAAWLPGERRMVEVEVRNVGPKAWPAGLAYGFDPPLVLGLWRRTTGETVAAVPERTILPLFRGLPRGAVQRFPVLIAAPVASGDYVIELNLSQRGHTLGPSAGGGRPAFVTVSATADRR